MANVSALVFDTGALINRIDLPEFSGNLVTIPEVLNEIRDKNTRAYVNVLPFKISIRTPSDDHIRQVQDFARTTGDLSALSITDVKLIALVRQLSVESGMTVRTEPIQLASWKLDESDHDVTNIPGFYIPKSSIDTCTNISSSGSSTDEKEPAHKEKRGIGVTSIEDHSCAEADDDEGWITPETLELAKISLNSSVGDAITDSEISVACMTFDFAIQNVLLQIGLHVLSPLKMLIKEARSYALRCYACFKIIQRTDIVFCPKCGHKTLEKVTISADADGNKSYALLRRGPLSMKGTRFSLPSPQGGKYAHNPVLIDHQPGAQQRASKKARGRIDALDVDFVARQSPFSLRDTTSRAAQLGFNSNGRCAPKAYWERKNPNVVVRKKK